jgi:putative hemolysin
MNRPAIWCAAGILLAATAAGAQTPQVFHGEVSDSQCAMNVHSLTRSHQEMLKSKSMGGTANTCSTYCIEHLGGYLVLVSGKGGKDVFRLDRADLIHGFEGQKVKVTGTLDVKANQIHVLKVELENRN